MKNKLLILSISILAGCAQTHLSTVDEASKVPEDCLNKKQIIEWLETQSQIQFKSTPLSEREYAKQLSAIKEKMWRIRYRCQPV